MKSTRDITIVIIYICDMDGVRLIRVGHYIRREKFMFMFIIANVRINFLDHQLFKSSKFGFNYLHSHIAHLKIMVTF